MTAFLVTLLQLLYILAPMDPPSRQLCEWCCEMRALLVWKTEEACLIEDVSKGLNLQAHSILTNPADGMIPWCAAFSRARRKISGCTNPKHHVCANELKNVLLHLMAGSVSKTCAISKDLSILMQCKTCDGSDGLVCCSSSDHEATCVCCLELCAVLCCAAPMLLLNSGADAQVAS